MVPVPLQDRTSICCLGLEEPSQKIELVFSASPETIRRGLGSDPSPSRQSAGPGSLRVHESRCFSFPLEGKVFYAATVRRNSARHEVLLSALYGEHVADHLPGNSQRGAFYDVLSPVLWRGSGRVRETVWAPAWQPRSALAGCALFCCLEIGMRITLSAELFSSPHKPQ